MKREGRNIGCVFACVAILATAVFCQAVGLKPAVAAPAKAATSPAAPKAARQDDWDKVVREARKEGKVTVYGDALGDTSPAWKAAFKRKYGIDIDFLMGRGGEMAQKLLSERRAGLKLYDVGIGGPTTFFVVLKPAKVVGSIDPLLLLEEVKNPANWRVKRVPYFDNDKTIIPLASMATFHIAVNPELVKEGEIKSYDDLLNPKWKGKIALNDPTKPGPGNQWFTFLMLPQNYGPKKGVEYVKRLIAQDLVVMRDERLQVESVAKGKYAVAIGMKHTLVAEFANAGAPIKAIKLSGKPCVLSGALNLYVSDAPAHPNAQKVLVNFLLGKEAGDILAKTSGYASERADVSTAGLDPAIIPGPNDVVLGEEYNMAVAKNMKIAGELFRDLVK